MVRPAFFRFADARWESERPSVYDLKSRFQGLLRPLMRLLVALRVTPNGLTLAALLGSAAVGVAVLLAYEERR